MANKLYDESKITDIGRAIQIQLGVSSSFSVAGMAAAIFEIKSQPILQSLSCSVNGTYSVPTGFDGFSQVVVSVPGGASAALSDKTITSNGTYTAASDGLDGFSQVVVSVPTSELESVLTAIIEGKTVSIINSEASKVRIYAFYKYGSLQTVDMPGVTKIGEYAFCDCIYLHSAYFSSCSIIGSYAFSNTWLLSVSFPACSFISEHGFDSAGFSPFSTIAFPNCLSIHSYAFQSCSMKGIELPVCYSVNTCCFKDCSKLETVIFGTGQTDIGESAFENCSSLTTVWASMTYCVQSNAFKNCTALSEISLPNAWYLYPSAFYGCTSLEKVYLSGSSVCALSNSNVFQNTPIAASSYLGHFGSIYVPQELVSSYRTANNWSYYWERITTDDVIEEEPEG